MAPITFWETAAAHPGAKIEVINGHCLGDPGAVKEYGYNLYDRGACAQRASAAGAGREELTKLLKEFPAGASRNDAATHDRFCAEDLIYTGSSWRLINDN